MGIDSIGKKGPPAPPSPADAKGPARPAETARPFEVSRAGATASAAAVARRARTAMERLRAGEMDVERLRRPEGERGHGAPRGAPAGRARARSAPRCATAGDRPGPRRARAQRRRAPSRRRLPTTDVSAVVGRRAVLDGGRGGRGARLLPERAGRRRRPPPPASTASTNVRLLQWDLGRAAVGARRARWSSCRAGAAPTRGSRSLVALHGRGEAMKTPAEGAMGWPRDYAMVRAIDRLRAPPLRGKDYEGFVDAGAPRGGERLARGAPVRGAHRGVSAPAGRAPGDRRATSRAYVRSCSMSLLPRVRARDARALARPRPRASTGSRSAASSRCASG